MANSAKDAGKDAAKAFGWWYSNRYLLLRRFSQITVLALFLLGPLFNIWWHFDTNNRSVAVLQGNYSSSMFLDFMPLTDPLMLLQSLATGYWPVMTAVIGGIIAVVIYSFVASRLFCSWVCPMNVVTDLAAWLRRKFGFRSSTQISRNLRYVAVVVILIGSAISGTLLWEWLNPVATLGRGLINGLSQTAAQDLTFDLLISGLAFGFGAGIWLIAAIFVFDLFVVEHGWCGHLCPIGAVYGVVGSKGILRISAEEREKCTRCMDCINVCPEAHVLRDPLFGKDPNRLVLSKDCISCGRCIDVCPEKVFQIKTRFHQSGVKE